MRISTGLNSDRIDVGIVLKEDRQTSVSVRWPSTNLVDSSIDFPTGVHSAEVSVVDGTITVASVPDSPTVEHLTLRVADDVRELAPGDGITIDPVRTGRGFHWQKSIQVTLPGELHFRARDGFLEVINRVDVESYVACVATSEMGASAPAELLAAQTIVARCWALALIEQKHRAAGFDVCDDDCCQRYQGTTFVSPRSIQAARDTAGMVLVHEGRVIDARYSKNCGGLVEDYTSVWEGPAVPYLVALWDAPGNETAETHYGNFDDYFDFEEAFCAPARFTNVDLGAMLGKVDVSGSYYRWQVDVALSTILENLRKYAHLDWETVDDVDIVRRGASARIIEIALRGTDRSGLSVTHSARTEYTIRQLFSDSFLYSSAFEILNSQGFREDGYLRLRGCGWGHGVGLCQMGALGMAIEGYSVEKILGHYYPGTDLRVLS